MIGVQLDFRRRAHALARRLILAEMVGRRFERDWKIVAVTRADADRAIGAAHRARRLRRKHSAVAAKQSIEKSTLLAGASRRAILLAAAVIRERDQQRLALSGAFSGASLEPLKLVLHAFKRVTLIFDAAGERPALRRRGRSRRIRNYCNPCVAIARPAYPPRIVAVEQRCPQRGSVRRGRDRCCRDQAPSIEPRGAGRPDWRKAFAPMTRRLPSR